MREGPKEKSPHCSHSISTLGSSWPDSVKKLSLQWVTCLALTAGLGNTNGEKGPAADRVLAARIGQQWFPLLQIIDEMALRSTRMLGLAPTQAGRSSKQKETRWQGFFITCRNFQTRPLFSQTGLQTRCARCYLRVGLGRIADYGTRQIRKVI